MIHSKDHAAVQVCTRTRALGRRVGLGWNGQAGAPMLRPCGCTSTHATAPFYPEPPPHPQINVANVDPEKGTYAVGDFKTVALAGYIRAKVRFGGLHVFVFDGVVSTTVGVGLLWVDGWTDEGPTEPMPLGSRILTTPCLSSIHTPHINQPNHSQGEADSALVEIVKKADSE